ncbi:ribonuclease M5 [Mycoplasmoides genitalium]
MDQKARIKIDGVIVCEGKTDQAKLQKIFDVDVITTNGSALKKETINLIKKISEKQTVILLLDPDQQGKKIRSKLEQHLTNYYNCYVDMNARLKNAKKAGIAEMETSALIAALNNRVAITKNANQSILWDQYLSLKLNDKKKRLLLCNNLNLPYFNHKQLFKKLNLLNLTFQDVWKHLK